jgi:hypothetical protein
MIIDKKVKTNIDINKMDNFQLARWAALVEGVNLIADMAGEKMKQFNNLELKPLALMKYIESTCDQICRKMNDVDDQDQIHENIKRKHNV